MANGSVAGIIGSRCRPAIALESSTPPSIVDRFEAVARAYPAGLAVQDMRTAMTYGEVAAKVDRVADAATAAIGDRAGPIAILLPAGALLPVAMLGVLKAGRAYVPLDADFPAERSNL